MSRTVHVENCGDPLCNVSTTSDKGEFLYSRRSWDKSLAKKWDIDMSIVTCKRCLKILNKKGK